MWFGPNMAIDFARTTDWIGYSLLSSLPISGLDDMAKGIMRQLLNASQWTPPAILGIALVLHKVLSVLLLFLVGLALRNHFKLK